MSVKQDRTYARTAQDIERKYAFGKSFAETLGLINDTRDEVDSVESGLQDEIANLSTTLKRDTSQIVMGAKKELSADISAVSDDVKELSSEVELKLDAEAVTIVVEKEIAKGIEELSAEVEMKLDAEAVTIVVEKEIAKGVERVETKTGYKFDSEGLNISKSGSEMTNLIDETGMYVKKSGDNVLEANNEGVKAVDLHAKTYLIVGAGEGRSRFEDYGVDRTGCFWVGG